MIGLTTGRETSQRLNILLKELASTIPNSRISRRGKSSLEDLSRRFVEEGFGHAVALYRWHGGPGRIEFFNVKPSGLEQVPPTLLLRSVKLRREYGIRGQHTINAITCQGSSAEARRLREVLTKALELPESESFKNATCSLHVRESTRETIELVVTSPPCTREIGPKLVISGLLWHVER